MSRMLLDAQIPIQAMPVNPAEVVEALGNNDEQVLLFICQMVAAAASSELRARLIERLGVHVHGTDNIVSVGDITGRGAVYDESLWSDEEWLP